MSGIADPRKNFRWALQIDGANMFLMQEVQVPTVEYGIIKHGAPINMPDGKTPGKLTVSEMTCKRMLPAQFADTWAWDWFGLAMAGVANNFLKPCNLVDLAPDGVRQVEDYVLGNIWPSKIAPSNRAMLAPGENIMEEITFAVEFFYPKSSGVLQGLLAGSAATAGGLGFVLGINT